MSSNLTTFFYREKEMPYFGPELAPHFILNTFKIRKSALVAFVGPCSVKTDHLVDYEDRLEGDFINAEKMVHFIGEFFGMPLRESVWLQRLLISTIKDTLAQKFQLALERRGDDIFLGDQKMSVSITTVSNVSSLLHIGIDLDATGAPVKAIGLRQLGFHELSWVNEVLKTFEEEWTSIDWACCKVRPITG